MYITPNSQRKDLIVVVFKTGSPSAISPVVKFEITNADNEMHAYEIVFSLLKEQPYADKDVLCVYGDKDIPVEFVTV